MSNYNPQEIESKWQKFWSDNQTFKANNNSDLTKYYVLDMFPYPSGAGLHVGHPLGYIASDIVSRYKRHQGFNVLHPMGYDSFGLPAEQYAIQTGQHPAITTEENISQYREQLDRIGFSFDWSREIRTSKPDYYKWTQWIFIQLFNSYYDLNEDKAKPIHDLITAFESEGNEKIFAETSQENSFTADEWKAYSDKEKADILLNYRLTYLAEAEVNWCPALGTVLANDEVINGVSERGGHPVIRKKMTQWMMRITAYSERLLKDLETIDWPQPIKDSQTNWIGKSRGASITFKIQNFEVRGIEVFTTRPDTIFGVSFMVLAPEHELVKQITTLEQKEVVEAYVEATAKRSERDRMADTKTISGVFTGAYAEHPFTKEPIPIWIGDYVLASYGTGAVMAVPAGDERDFAFANHFNIPIPNIFDQDISETAFVEKENFTFINSDFLNGLGYAEATEKIIDELEKTNTGKGTINYRLRDAVFSRQRYWGEPVPIYFKKGIPVEIPTENLPLELPEVDEYLPTETGEPPLGRAKFWAWDEENKKVVSNKFIDEEKIFPIELNTMPGWAGSSWYFNRYMDSANSTEAFSKSANDYWGQVDLYLGGSEHATGHLLYARFWQKFLYDLGYVNHPEFAKKLINQGMIQGMSAFVYRVKNQKLIVSKSLKDNYETDPIHVDISIIDQENNTVSVEDLTNWRPEFKDYKFKLTEEKLEVGREVEKMSKSKYNVINPDDICKEYGADTLRLYEMFLGPIEQSKPWNTQGLSGVYGFLKKYWRWATEVLENPAEKTDIKELKILHQSIKKVSDDIDNFSLNTSVSQFMIAINELTKIKSKSVEVLEQLTILLSPFAPHISEEIWQQLGNEFSVEFAKWPVFDPEYLKEDSKVYPISFNGKVRFKLEFSADASKEEIEKVVLEHQRTQQQLDGNNPKKIIVVPGRIVNIVI